LRRKRHERRSAAARGAGRGCGGPRRHRRGHPRPPADARARLARAPSRAHRGAGSPPSHRRRSMRRTYALEEHHSETLEDAKALVGGKAASLGVMVRELGLPVPPGFAMTTATCGAFLSDGWPADLDEELRERMTEIEAKAGRRFGDSADPRLPRTVGRELSIDRRCGGSRGSVVAAAPCDRGRVPILE